MSEALLAAIASGFGAVVSALSAIIVAKINRDHKKSQTEAERTNQYLQSLMSEVRAGNKVAVATARSVIAQIYNQNREAQTIEQGVWESVSDLYDGYKSVKIDGHTPNSWCDSMVDEMKGWKKC